MFVFTLYLTQLQQIGFKRAALNICKEISKSKSKSKLPFWREESFINKLKFENLFNNREEREFFCV